MLYYRLQQEVGVGDGLGVGLGVGVVGVQPVCDSHIALVGCSPLSVCIHGLPGGFVLQCHLSDDGGVGVAGVGGGLGGLAEHVLLPQSH